ncbi:hypothetical protein AVEN_221759-1 [Araneus ventricosus]|uniref:Uncharacterized protein n=1 Tax=Araneus ventricosus TaxID=182803 RepID=A0A4Y2FNQ3_ARAVE|nr:hypothetical protein AVEN_221759-1 [Araneus ventricosus]
MAPILLLVGSSKTADIKDWTLSDLRRCPHHSDIFLWAGAQTGFIGTFGFQRFPLCETNPSIGISSDFGMTKSSLTSNAAGAYRYHCSEKRAFFRELGKVESD